MLDFPRWKVTFLWLIVALGVFLSIPSLIAGTPLASPAQASAAGTAAIGVRASTPTRRRSAARRSCARTGALASHDCTNWHST